MFDSVESAIQDIKNGKMIIVVDDEDRENEGDLLMAAQHVTPQAINFMAIHGRGLVCMPITDPIIEKFQLSDMVINNTESMSTAFTVSIDAHAKHGVSTGISAADRAKTIQILLQEQSSSDDIVTPGHIFPLRARKMGVLRRAGHTEAAVDLARLAGLSPAGVICEIMKDDGEMARVPDLIPFAKKHELKIMTIKDLIQYRLKKETIVVQADCVDMPTEHGTFKLHTFEDTLNHATHVALVKGDLSQDSSPLVRVHAECFDGDIFRSSDNPSSAYLRHAMKRIEANGCGVIIYIRKQDSQRSDHVLNSKSIPSDDVLRDYGVGAQILKNLGIKHFRLLSNTKRKIVGLEGFGLHCDGLVHMDIDG